MQGTGRRRPCTCCRAAASSRAAASACTCCKPSCNSGENATKHVD
jgi:hypothetical protein